MYGEQLTQAFLDAAGSWVCEGFALEIRYIAVRRGEQLSLVEASVVLGPVAHQQDMSFSIETPGLSGGLHQSASLTKAKALAVLKTAAGGTLGVNNLLLALAPKGDDLDVYSEMTHGDRWFSPLHLRVAARNAGASGSSLVAALDAELRRASPPFDGTEDLAKTLGLDAQFTGARAPAISLSVLPPVELDLAATSLSGDTLTATLRAHSRLDLRSVGLAVRAVPGEGLASRRQVGDLIEWAKPKGRLRIGKARVSVPNSDSVLAMLTLGAFTVRRHWVVDPPKARNARFVAANQFDPDLREARKALFEGNDTKKFELAVGELLHTLGFATAAPIETDAPDLIASTPGGQSVVIECTLKIADFANKVGKLVERRGALSKALAAANLPASVVAILVCRTPRDEVAAAAKDLRNFDILLFTAEDLNTFLVRARFLSDPDELLKEAMTSLNLSGSLEQAARG